MGVGIASESASGLKTGRAVPVPNTDMDTGFSKAVAEADKDKADCDCNCTCNWAEARACCMRKRRSPLRRAASWSCCCKATSPSGLQQKKIPCQTHVSLKPKKRKHTWELATMPRLVLRPAQKNNKRVL